MKTMYKNYSECNKKEINTINRTIVAESLTLKQVAKSIPTANINIKDFGTVCAGEYLASFFGIAYANKPTFNACNIAKAWCDDMKIGGELAMYENVTLQRVPTLAECKSAQEANEEQPQPMDLYTLTVDKEGNESYDKVVFSELKVVSRTGWSVRRIIKAFTQKQTASTYALESQNSMEKAAKLLQKHKDALAKLAANDENVKMDDVLYYCKGFHMEQNEDGKKTRKYEYEPLLKEDVEFNLKVEDEEAE